MAGHCIINISARWIEGGGERIKSGKGGGINIYTKRKQNGFNLNGYKTMNGGSRLVRQKVRNEERKMTETNMILCSSVNNGRS